MSFSSYSCGAPGSGGGGGAPLSSASSGSSFVQMSADTPQRTLFFGLKTNNDPSGFECTNKGCLELFINAADATNTLPGHFSEFKSLDACIRACPTDARRANQ